MQVSFKSVRIFVTIRGKTWQVQLGNCQNINSHTSKTVLLLLVCLRNNRQLADHISKPYAKFYGKWYRIAYVIILDQMKWIPKPKFAPLKNPNSISGFVNHRVQSQR